MILVVTRSIPLHAGAGGMERASWDLVLEISKSREVEVLTTPIPGRSAEFEYDGVMVRTIRRAKAGRYSTRWWWGTARSKVPASTSCIISISGGASAMVWTRREFQYVIQVHGTAWNNARSLWRTPERRRLLKIVRMLWWVLIDACTYRRVESVVAVSDGLAEQFGRQPYRWLVPQKKVSVIPNGVDAKLFEFKANERLRNRKALGIEGDEVVAVTVSRLDEQKAVGRAINAVGRSISGTRLVIVGAGPEEGELRGCVAKLGVADRVSFVGRLDRFDVAAILSAADVLVFPVRGIERESLPVSVLEALAAGLRVIVPEGSRWPDDVAPVLDFSRVDDPDALIRAVEGGRPSGIRSSKLAVKYSLESHCEWWLRHLGRLD